MDKNYERMKSEAIARGGPSPEGSKPMEGLEDTGALGMSAEQLETID